METVNSLLLSMSPKKQNKDVVFRPTASHTTEIEEQLKTAEAFSFDTAKLVTVPPEDTTRVHLTEPYVGQQEEQKGTEAHIANESWIFGKEEEPEDVVLHAGSKRAASKPLEFQSKEAGAVVPEPERPKVIGDAYESSQLPTQVKVSPEDSASKDLQPSTPGALQELHSPEKMMRRKDTTTAAERETTPSPAAVPVLHEGVTTAFVGDEDEGGELVMSESLQRQFAPQLEAVKELRAKTSALQAVYQQEASMPLPSSERPETLLDEEPLMPVHTEPAFETSPEQQYETNEESLSFEKSTGGQYVQSIISKLPNTMHPAATQPVAWVNHFWAAEGRQAVKNLPALMLALVQSFVLIMLASVFFLGSFAETMLQHADAAGRRIAEQVTSPLRSKRPSSASITEQPEGAKKRLEFSRLLPSFGKADESTVSIEEEMVMPAAKAKGDRQVGVPPSALVQPMLKEERRYVTEETVKEPPSPTTVATKRHSRPHVTAAALEPFSVEQRPSDAYDKSSAEMAETKPATTAATSLSTTTKTTKPRTEHVPSSLMKHKVVEEAPTQVGEVPHKAAAILVEPALKQPTPPSPKKSTVLKEEQAVESGQASTRAAVLPAVAPEKQQRSPANMAQQQQPVYAQETKEMQKKRRGPIRGPLHKMAKEMRKVFGATA